MDETGSVGILNVGAGDISLSFSADNPAERIRAARIVKDMIRRGYALLVEVERGGVKKYERALDFNEKTSSYIIADFDPVTAALSDAGEKAEQELDHAVMIRAREREEKEQESVRHGESQPSEAPAPAAGDGKTPKRRGRPPRKEIPAGKTRAVAVGRSAGG